MSKGIREFTRTAFLAALPQRAEIGNTAFRKSVISTVALAFEISVASASTHYNHAFKQVKETNPESVEGLGRAEGKKGGRKAKVVAEVVVDTTPAVAEVAEVVVDTPTAVAEAVEDAAEQETVTE